MATAPNVQNLPIEQIDPSPDNPRLAFGGDLGDLTELTESIRAQGVLQHLVVCPKPRAATSWCSATGDWPPPRPPG